MEIPSNHNAFDQEVRRFIYRHFIDAQRAPSVNGIAAGLDVPPEEAAAALQRLQQKRVIVLHPGTSEIHMAMPFSALPTRFEVQVKDHAWWANCAWDALGIPAMLHSDAEISSICPDCAEPIRLRVIADRVIPSSGLVHFAVPARKWWEDIVFT